MMGRVHYLASLKDEQTINVVVESFVGLHFLVGILPHEHTVHGIVDVCVAHERRLVQLGVALVEILSSHDLSERVTLHRRALGCEDTNSTETSEVCITEHLRETRVH
jgi:hypothetical protein